jgi:DNA mismatch repair protein MutL
LYAESDLPAATVTGYVSPPEQSRPNRGQQAFFVNGRPIVSRLLAHALDQTFRPLIPDGRFAAAALFLEVPSEDVDVNVHPSKTEVRFRSEREVHSAISRAVRSALLLTPSVSRPETEETPPSPSVGLLRPLSAERPTVPVQQFLPESLMRGVPPSEEAWEDPFAAPAQSSTMPLEREAGGERPELDVEPTPPIETAPTAPLPEDTGAQPLLDAPPPNFAANRAVVEMLSRTRLLGQVMNTFLVGEGPDGIVLIDQHVAHERILYDRLVRTREGRAKMEIQRLLIPLTITLSGREAAALETRLSELEAFGFDIESYSGGTFLVRALPADLSHRNPEAILRDLAADLNEEWGSQRTVMEKAIDAVLASASCHGAIKANMPLGPAEMKRLVDDLMRTDDPFHCPHGRPIIVKITAAELFKWFKRTG